MKGDQEAHNPSRNKSRADIVSAHLDGVTPALPRALPSGLAAALNTEQASIYTGLAEKTLEGLRCRGGGPRFVRYGRKAVRYLVSDLDEWIGSFRVSSTSEPMAA